MKQKVVALLTAAVLAAGGGIVGGLDVQAALSGIRMDMAGGFRKTAESDMRQTVGDWWTAAGIILTAAVIC